VDIVTGPVRESPPVVSVAVEMLAPREIALAVTAKDFTGIVGPTSFPIVKVWVLEEIVTLCV
jgi:hypothetical protein